MNLKHETKATRRTKKKKLRLLSWLCILILSVSVLHPAAVRPLTAYAAGTGGSKGNHLPAGWGPEQQM